MVGANLENFNFTKILMNNFGKREKNVGLHLRQHCSNNVCCKKATKKEYTYVRQTDLTFQLTNNKRQQYYTRTMNCIGYLKIVPLQGTRVNVSISHSYGKLGTAKKSLTGDSIFVPLQTLQVLTIGRGSTKNIQLNNPTVSINHALVWCTQFDEDSSPVVYVHDQSRNTIWHNGTQMGKGVTTILNDGDIIKIQMAALITFKGVQDEIISLGEANLALEDWEITSKLLGSGSFGSVFVSKKANCSKLFAVKIIQNNRSSYFAENDSKTHESELLSKIKHVCIALPITSLLVKSY